MNGFKMRGLVAERESQGARDLGVPGPAADPAASGGWLLRP